MTQRVQISSTTLAAASRRRASARYAAEHVEPLTSSPLLAAGDADDLLARAYRLRRKKIAARVSAARTAALLR
ncbi:MAG: hypothetical protein QOI76_313 [Frankiales bacterium]|jgi:hypothetical protein|nr:hypothetical protein [Frankiales bacterium]